MSKRHIKNAQIKSSKFVILPKLLSAEKARFEEECKIPHDIFGG